MTINDIKALTVCLGFQPGVVGWYAQTNTISYALAPPLLHKVQFTQLLLINLSAVLYVN